MRRQINHASTHSFSIPYLDERIKRDCVLAANHISYRLKLLSKVDLSLVSAINDFNT